MKIVGPTARTSHLVVPQAPPRQTLAEIEPTTGPTPDRQRLSSRTSTRYAAGPATPALPVGLDQVLQSSEAAVGEHADRARTFADDGRHLSDVEPGDGAKHDHL